MSTSELNQFTHALMVASDYCTYDLLGPQGETANVPLVMGRAGRTAAAHTLTEGLVMHAASDRRFPRNVIAEALAASYGVEIGRANGMAMLTGETAPDGRSRLLTGEALRDAFERLLTSAGELGVARLSHSVRDPYGLL
ncbi:hypothetical protein [Streptomyces sp. NPDC001268]|uniref:hypothetical protein n=1 Tax=Streptomyces sp. NPDC001268 TaxID=3364553 RepID=UPI0036B4D0AE